MGYRDELLRSACRHCGLPVVLVPGYGWKHDDGVRYGPHYYECPQCGAVVCEYVQSSCPWCGNHLTRHHEAEGLWPPPHQR